MQNFIKNYNKKYKKMDYKPNFTTEKLSMNNNKTDNYEDSYVVTELEKCFLLSLENSIKFVIFF